jgi:hypothetical protein
VATAKDPKPKRKASAKAEMPAVPDALAGCPEFAEAWEAWQDDRRDRGKKVTPQAAKLQLGKLVEMGPERAVVAIKQSIANGWTGIFWPKSDKEHDNKTNNRNRWIAGGTQKWKPPR